MNILHLIFLNKLSYCTNGLLICWSRASCRYQMLAKGKVHILLSAGAEWKWTVCMYPCFPLFLSSDVHMEAAQKYQHLAGSVKNVVFWLYASYLLEFVMRIVFECHVTRVTKRRINKMFQTNLKRSCCWRFHVTYFNFFFIVWSVKSVYFASELIVLVTGCALV